MTCNYCGSGFHSEDICLMNPNFRTAREVPVEFHIELRERDRELDKEIYERVMERLKFEMKEI